MDGKTKCRILKGIRQRIADINGIDYEPFPCSNIGDCKGTCVQCEKELEWLWMQLTQKESQGYRIYITYKDLEEYEFQSNVTRCKTDTIGSVGSVKVV
ncbi:hypothetical protein [uncultured Mediterranea sp.]|uniref:hypothetical protein n=1 Tax=uncultured Mediterranea sp. TaxID=1926662 RepID=UPI0027D9B14F|nr:hypothetical protein [uncultured Mediterranea sp.]